MRSAVQGFWSWLRRSYKTTLFGLMGVVGFSTGIVKDAYKVGALEAIDHTVNDPTKVVGLAASIGLILAADAKKDNQDGQ